MPETGCGFEISIISPSAQILFPYIQGCRLLTYKVEALSSKKACISAVQMCKQASVRGRQNIVIEINLLFLPMFWS